MREGCQVFQEHSCIVENNVGKEQSFTENTVSRMVEQKALSPCPKLRPKYSELLQPSAPVDAREAQLLKVSMVVLVPRPMPADKEKHTQQPATQDLVRYASIQLSVTLSAHNFSSSDIREQQRHELTQAQS
jgi:hypothetical protein